MTKNDWAVLAQILKMAGDDFGNHICNDLELPNTPENRDLVERMERWNSVEQWEEYGLNISQDGTKIYTSDYFVMDYFAHVAATKSEE